MQSYATVIPEPGVPSWVLTRKWHARHWIHDCDSPEGSESERSHPPLIVRLRVDVFEELKRGLYQIVGDGSGFGRAFAKLSTQLPLPLWTLCQARNLD